MCPHVHGAGGGAPQPTTKFMYKDHEAAQRICFPPTSMVNYEVFHAEDVRLIWCTVMQSNDENASKVLVITWTIDGNTYTTSFDALSGTTYYIYRHPDVETSGSALQTVPTTLTNAAYYVDKRGQDFKVEVMFADAVGTMQMVICTCAYQTLDVTY